MRYSSRVGGQRSTRETMESYTQRAVDVFRECSRIPLLASATVVEVGGGRYEVLSKWNQRDLERGKKVAFTRSFFLEKKGEKVEEVTSTTFQADASAQVKVSHAPQSGVKAVLVKERPVSAKPSEEPQQFIEVWGRKGLEKTVAVADLKKHGKIHEDIHFGSFHVSASGSKLLYIAEKEKPKRTSFFKKPQGKSEDGKEPVQGAEFMCEDDWGEQLTSVVDPVVVVMSVESEECEVVEVGENVSAGQAVWVPGGGEGEVVSVGWENEPRKLGFVYCLNRPSALYHIQLGSGKPMAITDREHCVFSPRFSPQGDKLVFFQTPGAGPHRSCALLKMINWSTKQVVTVVDVVPRPATEGGFCGFYSTWLPQQCWDEAGKTLFCTENWGSRLKIVQVDVGSGEVRNVSDEEGAWSVMCVSHDLVVAQHASPSRTPRMVVGVVSSDMSHDISWTEISPSPVSMVTEGVTWRVLSFTADSASVPYEAILVKPRPSSAPPPLAVFPHGGPHGVIPADFLVWPVCLAALGTAVLLVNYRGSTGFGQDGIESLPGKIGRQDVDDVQRAVEKVVEGGEVDGEKVCVLGGSHGGFLSLHLVGQFPEFYKAASVRNPVVDIAGMRVSSDIPDWTYVECGVHFDPATPPKSEDVCKLLAHSPIIHSHKVKAGVLVLLGAEDKRCPPSQGLFLYHTLKAMGKDTRLHVYPGESHPISSVHCDADCFVNTAVWMHSHGCSSAA